MDRFLKTFVVATLFLTACDSKGNYDKDKLDILNEFPRRKDKWFKANPHDKMDPYRNLSREDYSNIAKSETRSNVLPDIVTPSIKLPEITSLLKAPERPEVDNDKLVSVSVNEEVPLKEVLIELARKAEVDVEVDKDISGGIIFIAHEKPFSEVIERIAKIADLRYKFEDGVLKITKDFPVVKTYRFNMLDITRNSTSTVNANIQVGGGAGGGTGGAAITSGSTSNLDIKSGDGDLWKNIEDSVNQIIAIYGQDKNPAPITPGQPQAQPKAGVGGAMPVGGAAILTSNRNAGVMTILANTKQHEAIKEYLDSIHISLTSQVLIEAKVIEVSLSDDYTSGINWSLFNEGGSVLKGLYVGNKFGSVSSALADGLTGATNTAGNDSFKFSVLPTEIFGNSGNTLDASVSLLQTFGITRSLSNPRISTMNNQSAVLNFSRNEVYFELSLEDQQTNSGTAGVDNRNVSIDSEIKTVPIGMILSLQPSVDLQRGEITMHIRPTLTKIADRVDDPSIILIQDRLDSSTTVNSKIPIVEVKEIDTVLRAKSGDIMVIGGLLEERANNTDVGVPGFSKIPYIGNAFKSVTKGTDLIETVILLKPTIVPGQGVSVEDKEFYEKFGKTRRKFFKGD